MIHVITSYINTVIDSFYDELPHTIIEVTGGGAMILAQLENRKEINVVLGDRVKKARLGQRLTREQLAERANVSARFLADVESGVTGVSLSTLRELCLILGLSADYLLDLSHDSPDDELEQITVRLKNLNARQLKYAAEIIKQYVEAVKTV